MSRLFWATLWILVGSALAGGVYWGFLNTPESSVGSLVLSAVLAVVSLLLAGLTLNGAMVLWSRGWAGDILRRAEASMLSIVPALVIVLVIWWLVGRGEGWVGAHSGEINAWFIARFGRDDVSLLFRGITWIARWLRWVLGPLLALGLAASISAAGWAQAFRFGWLSKTLSPVRLAWVTLWFGALVAAPWIYLVPWRPRGLPATAIELVFISAKLFATAVLMSIGAALMAREAVTCQMQPTTSTP